MHQHGHWYDQAQQEIVRASLDLEVFRMLDLGVGTGETSRRCLEAHPAARAVCLDESQDKLDAAARILGARAELRLGRFQDRLPEGPFQLIVSAFALHHVDAALKADLLPRVAEQLSEGGRFVLADVVEPHAPVVDPTPLDREQSVVSRTDELLDILRHAGFRPAVRWAENDLVVIAAEHGTDRFATPSGRIAV
jgi:tRNA (cmo5U34)-methyltransferase